MSETRRPAWGWSASPDQIAHTPTIPALPGFTPVWAWDGGTGAGVRVGVIDSGIDAEHPAVAGHVRGYATIVEDREQGWRATTEPHGDAFGHGTACADIIRRVAPDVELYSVKVLGARLSGKGGAFLAGLRWAIEQRMDVINLSLGTTKREFADAFHELADRAYFQRTILVTAANNMPVVSYPSLYASVISVASHEGTDPFGFYYNPAPPVEFLAPGIDLAVAWAANTTMTVTGNSFAAPHITGLVARLLGKHPHLTPFEIKTILRATARNARPPA